MQRLRSWWGLGRMQDPTYYNLSTRKRADVRLTRETLAHIAFFTCFPLRMARKSLLWRSPGTLCVSVQAQVSDFSSACASELLKWRGHRAVPVAASSAGCARVSLCEVYWQMSSHTAMSPLRVLVARWERSGHLVPPAPAARKTCVSPGVWLGPGGRFALLQNRFPLEGAVFWNGQCRNLKLSFPLLLGHIFRP